MASMRDIKRRRESIMSTEQITKAMKLVATVKLQKARVRAENSMPYSEHMYATVCSILKKCEGRDHRYLKTRESGKKAVLLITSNRGLAGGYNSNVIRTVMNSEIPKEEMLLYTIGRKGRDYLSMRGYETAEDFSDVVNAPLYKDAIEITDLLLKHYEEGKICEIWLAFTEFKNTVSHTPRILKLLPVEQDTEAETAPMSFEPDDETALDSIIPQYMTSLIYGALLESVASENGARMTAMDSATDNAEEMIDKLALDYNRARQGAITQELTEIIAGSQAIQ